MMNVASVVVLELHPENVTAAEMSTQDVVADCLGRLVVIISVAQQK